MILIKKLVPPDIGEVKIKSKFAFLPIRIGDKIIWLERFELIYIFAEQTIDLPDNKSLKFKGWILTYKRCKTRT